MANTNPDIRPSFNPEKKKRGFASMDRDQVREFARRGGVAAHRAGTAHEFNSNEAREAGRKGGLASHASEKRPVDLESNGAPTIEQPTN
jgi:general stress protein YciG